MTVKEIVEEHLLEHGYDGVFVEAYLREHGYDGLFKDRDCACALDDLMPCSIIDGDCEPGYKHPCSCGDGHAFHISRYKEPSYEALQDL